MEAPNCSHHLEECRKERRKTLTDRDTNKVRGGKKQLREGKPKGEDQSFVSAFQNGLT